MTPTERELRTLQEAFDAIDFSQPKAHEIFNALAEKIAALVTHIGDVSNREFRFYALGAAYEDAHQKYLTIPPLNVDDSTSEGKKQ